MDEFTSAPNYAVGERESLAHTPHRRAGEVPERVVIRRPRGEAWIPVTAADFAAEITAVAKGLIARGVQAGDRVAIMSDTRYEWTLLDFAVWSAGAVSVPVYPSSSASQLEWILEDSESVMLIVETDAHLEIAEETTKPACLKDILAIEHEAIDKLSEAGVGVGDDVVSDRLSGLRADLPATLIYTSGTTGRPKGCVLTHHNLMAEVRSLLNHPVGEVARPGRRVMMFLPMAHVLARAVTLAALEGGATVGHWGDFQTVTSAFATFKPNMVLGVPRVFEKVRDGAANKAKAESGAKGAIFLRAEATAIAYSESLDKGGPGPILRARHALFDKLVYSKLRAALGGDCQYAISGGGALMPWLGHFFRGIGVPVYEGYGLTESSAAHCVNGPGAQKMGTVGRPIPGNSVKVAEDGELLLKGQVIFREYWKNAQATEDAFVDGWFHSGDIGTIDADGYVAITGRKKDILVTAGGKNVSPGPLEDRLRANALISQAVVVGDGRPFIAALITVDEEALKGWASDNGKTGTTAAELWEDQDLRSAIHVAIDDANSTVSHAEAIKKFVILRKDLTEEDGDLTATLKVKRPVVTEKYARLIEKFYKD